MKVVFQQWFKNLSHKTKWWCVSLVKPHDSCMTYRPGYLFYFLLAFIFAFILEIALNFFYQFYLLFHFLFPWLKTKCSALMRKESKLYFWVNTTSWLHWVTALSREFSLSFDIQIANLKQLHALKKIQMVMYTEYLISKLNSTSRTIAKATVKADKITAKMVSKGSRFHLISAGSLAMALVWRVCCHGAKQVCEIWNIFLAFRSTNM